MKTTIQNIYETAKGLYNYGDNRIYISDEYINELCKDFLHNIYYLRYIAHIISDNQYMYFHNFVIRNCFA